MVVFRERQNKSTPTFGKYFKAYVIHPFSRKFGTETQANACAFYGYRPPRKIYAEDKVNFCTCNLILLLTN